MNRTMNQITEIIKDVRVDASNKSTMRTAQKKIKVSQLVSG